MVSFVQIGSLFILLSLLDILWMFMCVGVAPISLIHPSLVWQN
jgi:hypothetical protein